MTTKTQAIHDFAQAPVDMERFREQAARVCDETAKWERKERGPLRTVITGALVNEFPDEAFGIASELATDIADSILRTGAKYRPDMVWDIAAGMLRNGWKRGMPVVSIINDPKAPKS